MNSKWNSRKLVILIFAVAGIAASILSESVTVEDGMINIVKLVIAYFAANGGVHIAKAIGGLYNGVVARRRNLN